MGIGVLEFCPCVHCEKSLFVLASRQKVPLLRTENPSVDTGTIYPEPIFTIPHAIKVTAKNPGQ
jgi:hypothetical protein